MDLVTLDDNHQPSKLIENYDSLVWTERFIMGDFQITTSRVDEFLELLPEGQVLTLRESNVPMIVETHKIENKKNKPSMLTIVGREYTSILDRRISLQQVVGGAGDWSVVGKIPSDAAYYAIYKICVEGSADPLDIFSSSVVQFVTPADYLTSAGPNRQYTIPRGNLLNTVTTLLQTESKADPTTTPATPAVVPHGLRAIRPDSAGTAVGVEIYTGTDRSEQVYFDGTRDLLDDGTYLFSKVGSATTAYAIGSTNAVKLNKSDSALSGLDRRVILVDGSTSDVNSVPALTEQGKIALSEAHVIAAMDGSINQELSPYTYGVDYYLGDTVKLVGDYGLVEKARVTEYIRAEDATGVKAYPTLTTINE